MKLDKRIENDNSLEDCDCRYGELVEHDDVDYAYPYCCESDDGCGDGGTTCDWFAFYIPESSLKQKQKQFRPYTFMEFCEKFSIGLPIKFRKKGAVGCERYLILNGYEHEHDEQYIYIGHIPYTLNELFRDYEWQEHYTEDFEPFGVEQ